MTDTIVENSQFVTFRLEQELFGVEVKRAREILDLILITSVPQTPDYMLGVVNLRGQVVPVVDMRLKLGLSAGEATQDTCIVVMEVQIEDETIVVGALVDAVYEVLEINSSQIEPPPKLGTRLKTEFMTGMGKVEDQFIILLNIEKAFSSEEIALVQDMQESNEATTEKELVGA